MNVLYEECASWEKSFIEELLGLHAVFHFTPRHTSTSIAHHPIDSCVLVLNSNEHHYKEALSMAQQLKPRIIFLLADEWGTRSEFNELAAHTRLLVRQYHHGKYKLATNVMHMPLGYMVNMFGDTPSTELHLAHRDRRYTWSFIGNLKAEGQAMLSELKSLTPHLYGHADAQSMAAIYKDSVFVPNRRGNMRLDCFRLYEASACGAIPIVVGTTQEEIDETFLHEQNPPWIFATSWPQAKQQMCDLLACPEKLNDRHQQVIAWWKLRVETLKECIASAFHE